MNTEKDILTKFLNEASIAAQRAYTRGIQTGNGGNLSVKLGDESMLVKSSGGSFAECFPDGRGFVCTDFNGKPEVEGQKPTREVFLHGLLYQVSKWGAVVHCHSPWSIAWSFGHSVLPCLTLHSQLKICHDIPVLDIDTPAVTEKDRDRIANLFKENPDLKAFILARHGVVALGKNVLEAEHLAELIEETAQIACIQGMMHGD